MIRTATPADATAIADLWNPVIRDTTITFNPVEKTPDDIIKMIAERALDGHGFFVAYLEDTLVGFATYGQFRGGAGYRFTVEHTIQLSPLAQGKGIGRALMTTLCDDAKAAGMHSMWACVSAENQTSVAFHAAIGFDTIAELPQVGFKFGRLIDLVMMQRRL
jgi:L-amino acid N-acyltransferase YncA